MKSKKLAIVIVINLLLPACGGGSSDNSSTPVVPIVPVVQPIVIPPAVPVIPTVPDPTSLNVDVRDGTTINEDSLYVVANTADPTSVILASEYATSRGIPANHIINVVLPVKIEITTTEAQPLTSAIANNTDAKGFALAWTMPYRVGANQSITSFVSNGQVAAGTFTGATCDITPSSTYYNYGPKIGTAIKPANNTIKPAMLLASYTTLNGSTQIDPVMLAGNTTQIDSYLTGIRKTIAQGLAADYKNYSGTAYYLKTTDSTRSARYLDQQTTATTYQNYLNNQYLQQNTLGGKTDILIYETGLAGLDPSENNTNVYLPGAIADTLTSYSGRLYDSGGQISILSYLKAGATASFGTVREPCAYTAKFPQASVLEGHLLSGDSILEAYNKSVMWPTEGLFIGEPLARPYSRIKATVSNSEVSLQNIGGIDGNYNVIYDGKTVATNVSLKQKAAATNIGKITFTGSNLFQVVLQ